MSGWRGLVAEAVPVDKRWVRYEATVTSELHAQAERTKEREKSQKGKEKAAASGVVFEMDARGWPTTFTACCVLHGFRN